MFNHFLISLYCPRKESFGPVFPTEHAAKTLIRLGGCPVLSESSQSTHSFCWFCHVFAQLDFALKALKKTSSTSLARHN